DVPQRGEQPVDRLRASVVRGFRQQDQQVDIGMREQLATSIAADADERRRRWNGGFPPCADDDLVGQPRKSAQQPRWIGSCNEVGVQTLAALRKLRTPMRNARLGRW